MRERVVKAIKHCSIVMVEDNDTKSKLRIGQGPPLPVGRSPILSSYIPHHSWSFGCQTRQNLKYGNYNSSSLVKLSALGLLKLCQTDKRASCSGRNRQNHASWLLGLFVQFLKHSQNTWKKHHLVVVFRNGCKQFLGCANKCSHPKAAMYPHQPVLRFSAAPALKPCAFWLQSLLHTLSYYYQPLKPIWKL